VHCPVCRASSGARGPETVLQAYSSAVLSGYRTSATIALAAANTVVDGMTQDLFETLGRFSGRPLSGDPEAKDVG
jgi:hypothetical protein